MATIQLLGPVQLWTDGHRHDLGSLKERSVLAALALQCGHPAPVDTLIDRLWDGHPPPSARDTLNSYVSRLRRRLRHAAGDAARIASEPGGYTLVIDQDAVDLHRFRRLCRQALAIAETGDDEDASSLLREAEGLWGGEPLTGLPGDWMRRIRESVDEERHTAHVARIEIELRLGRHAGAVGELHRLAAHRPLDEHIAELRMVALFRCDRQADALDIYHRTRELLIAELGVEPGPRLQETHQRILRRDVELAVTPRYRRLDHAPQPNTLPPDTPDFTGRDRELRTLLGERAPVHVIEGMPGIGKSALAVHAAHRLAASHPDAQLHVRLRGPEPDGAPKTAAAALVELLRMLGIAPTRIPPALDARAALWRREMADRRAVVVLDDATGAEQLRPLLPRSAACRVLVTTRRALHGLDGASRLRLDVLSPGDSAALFTRLAGGGGRHAMARELIRCCAGLPLMLRLAAGRFRGHDAHDLPEVADEMIDDLIGPGSPEAEIRAAFDLAYQDLDGDQQRIFRRLGLAPCHQITEHAAAALGDASPGTVRAGLAALLGHHLLLDAGPRGVGFHDLLRAYARDRAEHADTSHERRRSLHRLLDYYLVSADRADRVLHPHRRRMDITPVRHPHVAPALTTTRQAEDWMDREWQNALQVAEHAVQHEWKEQGALLVHALAEFLETHGYWEDAAAGHENALQACRDLDDRRGIGQASLELGFVRFRTGHHDAALRHTGEALTIHRTIADPHAEAETLDQIGIIHWSTARYREAIAHCQEALALYRGVGDLRGEADAHGHCAIAYWHLGRYDESIASLDRALQVYRHIGDRRGEAMTLNNLGDVQQHRGYHRDAVELYQRSSRIFEEITGLQNAAILQNNLGNVHRYKGDHRAALRCYRDAMATYRATGDRRNIVDVLNNIGDTYRLMERYSEALVHHEKALTLTEEIAEPYERTRALCGIGRINQETGGHHAALDRYGQAITEARKIGDTYQEAVIHDGIARTVLQLHGPKSARIHWRQALDLFQALDVPEAQAVAIRLQTIDDLAS